PGPRSLPPARPELLRSPGGELGWARVLAWVGLEDGGPRSRHPVVCPPYLEPGRRGAFLRIATPAPQSSPIGAWLDLLAVTLPGGLCDLQGRRGGRAPPGAHPP